MIIKPKKNNDTGVFHRRSKCMHFIFDQRLRRTSKTL